MRKLFKIVIIKLIKFLKKKKSEINCFLSGENDDYDIYLEIHAGAGGTESQDWADMLKKNVYEMV